MKNEGIVFDIQRWSIRDGYGIRTNVFLKGCPLSCKWCCNPESQKNYPELAYFPDKCINCRNCERDCPYNAIFIDEEGKHRIDREICKNYCFTQENGFQCLSRCYAEALKKMGNIYTADEVLQEVLSDIGIYQTSGGGVTFTGGEPFIQHEFLLTLLRKSKETGIHTTIETSACVQWEVIEKALPYIDFIFIDLKIFDDEKHMKFTGRSNSLILENIKKIDSFADNKKITMAIRMPIIPGINNSDEDVKNIARWIRENLKNTHIFQPLAYHRLGRGKYMDIGREYELEDIQPLSENELHSYEEIIRSFGLETNYA